MLVLALFIAAGEASTLCAPAEIEISLMNATSRTLTGMVVRSSTAGSWSEDLLGVALPPGGTTSLCVIPGDADVRITDDTSETLAFEAFTFKLGETFVVSE